MKKCIMVFLLLAVLLLTACGDKTNSADILDVPDPVINPYLVLVNKENPLPNDWLDMVNLVTVDTSLDEMVAIEEITYKNFLELQERIYQETGVYIELDSVYRSTADQEELWDYFKLIYGEEYCKEYVAVPGYSEHHTGLAVDICLIEGDKVIIENDDMLAETETFATIHAIMPEYGFILRYPPGKEDITGYSYEPWHLRFVGVPVAKEITNLGITLEEYLAMDENVMHKSFTRS